MSKPFGADPLKVDLGEQVVPRFDGVPSNGTSIEAQMSVACERLRQERLAAERLGQEGVSANTTSRVYGVLKM